MKIAICDDDGGGFSSRWLAACRDQHLEHVQVSLFDGDLLDRVRDCTHFLCRPLLYDLKTNLFAAGILRSLEEMNLRIFPSVSTFWHYDNKVAQKYLLEAIDAPLAPAHVFFDAASAGAWLATAPFPLVFKLRGGAGSANVKLIRSHSDAMRMVRIMFGKGMIPVPSYLNDARTKLRNAIARGQVLGKVKRLPSVLLDVARRRGEYQRDRGYIYYQEFLPANEFDTRITVIGNRAFGYRRFVRKNDFRASGSGNISYDKAQIDPRCVKIAMQVSQRLGFQSMAYDFAFDREHNPKLLEMSYTYVPKYVFECPGYWSADEVFHEGNYWPQDCIIEDLLSGSVISGDVEKTAVVPEG